MNKDMTVEEVIKDAVITLGSIKVPMDQIQEIGIPVSRVLTNLGTCLRAFAMAKKEQDRIELVETDEVPPEDADVVELSLDEPEN